MTRPAIRFAVAACTAASGYLHTDLYLHGYRSIPLVGPAFLLQGAGSFAIALLLLAGAPLVVRLGAAGLALGALAGFALSRTAGIGSFVEHGFQPAPQALISVLVEVATLVLLVAPVVMASTGLARRNRSVSSESGTRLQ
ncbi:hypothetical protein [Amycolatopsis pigmentata]|uniref:DUF4345 domain-containing protein n=1 Tax=Amycolatopsis pigmentata TaxID=450801 RepID=A0ABW5FSU1_9PSEU